MALILVTGGARSGKSRFAEELAGRAGERVLYIATADPGPAVGGADPEMAERIRRHRARRPPAWATLEEPREIERALQDWLRRNAPPDAVLLDCVTLLLSNWLLAVCGERPAGEGLRPAEETEMLERVRSLACYLHGLPFPAIAVSNETGWGVVPPTPLGRAFRDLAGLANQQLAERAEAVYVLWSGIPVEVKALDARRGWRQT